MELIYSIIVILGLAWATKVFLGYMKSRAGG